MSFVWLAQRFDAGRVNLYFNNLILEDLLKY